jgi:hypothetical protein
MTPGASTGGRVTRNIARWAVIATLILGCAVGASRAAEDFLDGPSWSTAGSSIRQGAVYTGPWLVQVGLILALIFKWRRVGLALSAAASAVLVYEPLSRWASFTDLPGPCGRYYLLYLVAVLAVFPIFHRRAPRHGRPPETGQA